MDFSLIKNKKVRLRCRSIINCERLTLEEKRDIGVIITSYVLSEKLKEVLSSNDLPSDL